MPPKLRFELDYKPYLGSKIDYDVGFIGKYGAIKTTTYNINVNAVCPGVVPTAMWEGIDKTQSARLGLQQGGWIQKTLEGIPLKRAARLEDIAATVSFLCSEDADYITGQALNVDGGMEMN